MGRLQRLIAASVLVAFSGALVGCSNNVSSFDPMDWLDWIDTKKKLPGERKPVFPDGVPGLEQGVPKALYKGAQEGDQSAQQAVAVPPPPPPPPETKPKKSARKKPAAATASTDPAAAADGDTPPAPKKKIVRQRTTAPPPDQPAQSAPQTSAAPFPAPLPGGTITR